MYKAVCVLFLGLVLNVSWSSPPKTLLAVKELAPNTIIKKHERDPEALSALVESTINLMAPKTKLSQPIEVTKLTPK